MRTIEHTETRGSPSIGTKRAAKAREQVFKPPEDGEEMSSTTANALTKDQNGGLGSHTDLGKMRGIRKKKGLLKKAIR